LEGEPPDPLAPPPGCGFSPRCPVALDACRSTAPGLEAPAPGRLARCVRATELLDGAI
jgi:oligopeptide/dipeptide ABC transporter ATP-binding protein